MPKNNTDLEIRALTPADADVVEQMEEEFDAYMRALDGDTSSQKDSLFSADVFLRDGFGENPAFYGFMAEKEGTPAGYLLYSIGYETDKAARILYIIDLFVKEEFRKHGIGKALMQKAADTCKEMGGHCVTLEVYTPNKTAVSFYEKLGAKFLTYSRYMYWLIK